MASVDLTGIPIATATPSIRDFGGVVGSAVGGGSLRINRLGSRWAWMFETRPLRMGTGGQYWAGMLVQARRDGALLKVSQPDVAIGTPGSPVVSASTAAGRVIPVLGLTAGYQVKRGQWLSFETAAGRFLDMNLNDVIADGAGAATLLIANLLRAPLAAGDVVQIAAPKIEGWITDMDSWTVDRARTTVFSFTIEEPR